jgi:hypothetical protein
MPSKILRDSNEITDSKAIANAFNDFFTNIGHNLAQSIPDTAKPVMSFMPVQQSNSFFLNATSPKEIENEINMLKLSKSTGPNSIPISILKLLATVISKPLECIFNRPLWRFFCKWKHVLANWFFKTNMAEHYKIIKQV